MGEYNPYEISEFVWDVLQVYIKHGYGECKLYDTTFFNCGLTDESAVLTLNEFAERAIDYEGEPYKDRDLSE
jgi:hypothetical protein